MSAPTTPRSYSIYADSTNGIPSPITPNLTANHSRSLSQRSVIPPRIPSLPSTPTSPRKRNLSFHDPESRMGLMSQTSERIRNIIEILDRNDAKETMYQKCPNCCIFQNGTEEKSYTEKKFIRREYPSYFSNDRQFFRFLIHQFDEAVRGVSERFPGYYSPSTNTTTSTNITNASNNTINTPNTTNATNTTNNNFNTTKTMNSSSTDDQTLDAITSELDMWFTLFDETICQESSHSRVTAFIQKNIMDVFRGGFSYLIDQVKRSKTEVMRIEAYYRKKLDEESQLPPLHAQIASLKADVERQKREYEALQRENSRFHVENFELKGRIEQTKESVDSLLGVADVLRGHISINEQRIHEMSRQNEITPMDPTFGAVPADVLQVWDGASAFVRSILDDSLDSFDLDEMMPEYTYTSSSSSLSSTLNTSETICPFVHMPRSDGFPHEEGTTYHFTQLYKSILFASNGRDPARFFQMLETKVRELFQKFGAFHYRRVASVRKMQTEHISKLTSLNRDLRRNSFDPTEWISVVLQNADLFNLPKKLPDVLSQIMTVFAAVPNLMAQKIKPQSTAEVVLKVYAGGTDLLLFLALVSRQSQTDIFTDIFRQFIVKELPFHMFIFYAKMCLELDKSDGRKRATFLTTAFNHVGYNQIPLKQRKSFETLYCPAIVTFEVFSLALYQTAVENIAIHLSSGQIEDLKEIGGKDQTIEQSISKFFKLNELETLEMHQYMLAISEKSDPSAIEFAVCAFDRKMKFDNIFQNFDPSQSKILEYMANFGQAVKDNKLKMKKQKKPKKGRASSARASNCSNLSRRNSLPLTIGNLISSSQNDFNQHGQLNNNDSDRDAEYEDEEENENENEDENMNETEKEKKIEDVKVDKKKMMENTNISETIDTVNLRIDASEEVKLGQGEDGEIITASGGGQTDL